MIFSLAPAVAPIVGGWAHVAFGWRAVFAFMVICGVMFSTAAWWRLPETHPPAARIPFNARNLVATSLDGAASPGIPDAGAAPPPSTSARSPCFIGAAPAIVETALGHERDLVRRAVPAGDRRHPASAPWISRPHRRAHRSHAPGALRVSRSPSRVALVRVHPAPGARPTCPSRCSRRCCSSPASARSSRSRCSRCACSTCFPAARGTAASAQSFVALLVTAFTLGIVSPQGAAASRVDGVGVAGATPAWRRSAGISRGAGTNVPRERAPA